MPFHISYSPIRASSVLWTCFCFDFSLHFATFVYTFIMCYFFYFYPPFFFSRLLHTIFCSFSLYFLFLELISTRLLSLLKFLFPAFSLRLFLATFSFIPFHKFLPLCLLLLYYYLSIDVFHRFVSFRWLSLIFFFIYVSSFPVSAHFSAVVYFPFHIRVLRGSLTVSVTNATQYSIIYPTVHIFLSACDCPCLQTQLTSQLEGCKGGNMKNDFMRSHFVVAFLSFLLNNT